MDAVGISSSYLCLLFLLLLLDYACPFPHLPSRHCDITPQPREQLSTAGPRTALSIRRWLVGVSAGVVSRCVLGVNMHAQSERMIHTLRCPSLTLRWLLYDSEHENLCTPKASLQVGLGDVEYSFPSVEPFSCEHLGVLGKTQSRQAVLQVAHVEGHTWTMSECVEKTGVELAALRY